MTIYTITTINEFFRMSEQISQDNIVGPTTLRTQFTDPLNFHNISVWELKDALGTAYELGRGDCRNSQHKKAEN